MHTADEFKKLAKQAPSGQLRMRNLALHHFTLGEARSQTAINFGVARGSVNSWVSNYLKHGLEGLQKKPRPEKAHPLSEGPAKTTQVLHSKQYC
jgi:transposase